MPDPVSSAASWLFVPGDRPSRFRTALGSPAHAVVCDLEDAVGAGDKEQARAHVAALLAQGARVAVRINATGTPWHEADLAACAAAPTVLAVMVPKAEDPEVLSRLGAQLGPAVPLVALIETAVGLARSTEIAAVGSVARLAFGSIDYALDIAAADTETALLHARSTLVLAARLAAMPPPVDGVTVQFRDQAATRSAARAARSLGFGGKLCIHPDQIALVNTEFGPDAAEIAWARRVLAAGSDRGAAALEGEMIDEPVRARARRILGLAAGATAPTDPT